MTHPVQIGRRLVGPGQSCFIIAEAGVNHNGDMKQAKRLVDEAKKVGADCVKFQTFRAEEIVTSKAPKAEYQLRVTDPAESQLAMLKKLELPKESFAELLAYCNQVEIQFLSTPYSFHDVDLLAEIGVEAFKIASGQLTELPFLSYVARQRKPMILSTGMATLQDVREAVDAIRAAGLEDMVLLQCTTNYPARIEDANLRVITTLSQEFKVPVGYSDHTVEEEAVLGAVALDACVIEKHFTLDRRLAGPDHSSSLEPAEMARLVQGVRIMEKALGRAEKIPAQAEVRNAAGMKRSLASTQVIFKGTRITREMITFKRPATGLPPKSLEWIIGKEATRDILPDTILTADMING
jgi:N,N'-diacetyllegionaminate synthase